MTEMLLIVPVRSSEVPIQVPIRQAAPVSGRGRGPDEVCRPCPEVGCFFAPGLAAWPFRDGWRSPVSNVADTAIAAPSTRVVAVATMTVLRGIRRIQGRGCASGPGDSAPTAAGGAAAASGAPAAGRAPAAGGAPAANGAPAAGGAPAAAGAGAAKAAA